MIISAHVEPDAIALLEEATARGVWIELKNDELHTYAKNEDMSQPELDEFTIRLKEHQDGVAVMIALFGLAERNGTH